MQLGPSTLVRHPPCEDHIHQTGEFVRRGVPIRGAQSRGKGNAGMKRFFGVLVGAFLAIGLTAGPALAWSNDTTAKGVSECASKKDATAKITWTITIDTPPGYHGRTVVTQSNDSNIPVNSVLTDGQVINETRAVSSLPFTLALKVNYPDPGGDSKWYPVTATPGGSLTVRAPQDCQPVPHSPQLVGSGACDETTGEYVVTYDSPDTDGATSTDPSLPVVHRVPGVETSDSASVRFVYADGPDVDLSAGVELAGTCKKPTPKAIDPSASIRRPTCVSRFFTVTLNNAKSTVSTTFRIYRNYKLYSARTVAAGKKLVIRFRAKSKELVRVRVSGKLMAQARARSFSTCSAPPFTPLDASSWLRWWYSAPWRCRVPPMPQRAERFPVSRSVRR
jgi:hypothetical protein